MICHFGGIVKNLRYMYGRMWKCYCQQHIVKQFSASEFVSQYKSSVSTLHNNVCQQMQPWWVARYSNINNIELLISHFRQIVKLGLLIIVNISVNWPSSKYLWWWISMWGQSDQSHSRVLSQWQWVLRWLSVSDLFIYL